MSKRSISKGLLAGALGGIVGTYAMTWAQKGLMRLEQSLDEDDENGSGSEGSDEKPATVKAADRISRAVRDRGLTDEEEGVAGQLMHYAMGATSGAIYGMATATLPIVSVGVGLPFGVVLFLVADEIVVPATDLSDPPAEVPPEAHARGLIAHLAFGLATDLTRRAILEVID